MPIPNMYCPNCRDTSPCATADHRTSKDFDGGEDQRKSDKRGLGINWFHRVRQCPVCSEIFATAELDEDLLVKLIDLFASTSELQGKIREYLQRRENITDSSGLPRSK